MNQNDNPLIELLEQWKPDDNLIDVIQTIISLPDISYFYKIKAIIGLILIDSSDIIVNEQLIQFTGTRLLDLGINIDMGVDQNGGTPPLRYYENQLYEWQPDHDTQNYIQDILAIDRSLRERVIEVINLFITQRNLHPVPEPINEDFISVMVGWLYDNEYDLYQPTDIESSDDDNNGPFDF